MINSGVAGNPQRIVFYLRKVYSETKKKRKEEYERKRHRVRGVDGNI